MDTMQLSEQLEQQTGVTLAALLKAVSDEQPAGVNVRGNGVFNAIQLARQADDPTLPMGQWEHDLKQADWHQVVEIATVALQQKSKDLQLAMWLLEAQIYRWGFEGIAPSIFLIQQLCEKFWPDLFPKIVNEDLEYRINIFRWANEKLPTAIKLIPLTQNNRKDYCWSDWEVAHRNEHIKAQLGKEATIEGPMISDIHTALAATPSGFLQYQHQLLEAALASFDQLSMTLAGLCGDEAPSLSGLTGLLANIQQLTDSELRKRGYRLQDNDNGEEDAADDAAEPPANLGGGGGSGGQGGDGYGRAEAYQQLAAIADYLSHVEPHSPVPALLRRAVEWGNMSTGELYHQLFIQCQGQLNIFELLGIAEGESR
ncbi:type VI secretion system protein TssA [Gynuella sp.]|uniref:type VI secretion system protein TssA n=1 Tax=Gynuella sp. TaxID=2969146 RepID=UPI003D0BA3A5